MVEKEDKPKEHMLSGFFDRCREMYDGNSNKQQIISQDQELDMEEEIAKIKLKKIREILNS